VKIAGKHVASGKGGKRITNGKRGKYLTSGKGRKTYNKPLFLDWLTWFLAPNIIV